MKKLLYGLLCSLIIIAGCSAKEEKPVAKADSGQQTPVQKPEKVEAAAYEPKEPEYYEIEGLDRELTEIEKNLLRKPGPYSGDQYDEQKLNEALDQLPDDLTAEQYLEEMLQLLSEDYYEGMNTFLFFDTAVDVEVDRPDESLDSPTLKTAHYAILIDASGSMKAASGNKTRMEAAKEAVKEFAGQIPEDATVSLRVYGHKGSGSDADQALSCSSTENFYSGQFDDAGFKGALDKVQPAGWTPIGLALQTVKEDIPPDATEAVVYVVSDGIETCGGDPVKEAGALVSGNIETVVNIIGYDVDNEGQTLLKKVADAGNGEFTYVNSEKDLRRYMRAQYEEIQKSWWEWKEQGQEKSIEKKKELQALAKGTKESMQAKSLQERKRMKKAREYLKTRFPNTSHAIYQVRVPLIENQLEKYDYITKTGLELYSESTRNGHENYNEITKEGHEKSAEFARKKHRAPRD